MEFKRTSQIGEVWRRLKKNKLAVFGLCLLALLILVALFSGLIFDYETEVIKQDVPNSLQPPSAEHWFGTDHLGRDIFARVVYGTRYSLAIGFLTASLALIIGGAIGAVAGYFGGVLDTVLMRIIDILMAIPSIVLAIAIVTALGTGFQNLVIAMTISSIPTFTRLLRSSVLSIKNSEYVEASRCLGTSTRRIILRQILPNCIGPIIVQGTFAVASAILSSSGLSFLGIGVEPPAPEWGTILSQGKDYLESAPYVVIFPGCAIALTVLALNLAGDGLRDALDPRLKK